MQPVVNADQPPKPSVSVVIGSLNRRDFLAATIATVRTELPPAELEIIVVDGGSDDGTLEWLLEQKDVITVVQHNKVPPEGAGIRRSWGYFMNLGFRAATAPVICMLSDDCLVVPGAIRNGLDVMATKEEVGAVAFFWRNWPEQRRYRVGYTFGGHLFVNHGLYRKAALESVGFADDDGLSFYHADGDMCLRLWENGWTCVASRESFVEHYSHANVEQRKQNNSGADTDWAKFAERWGHLGWPVRNWETQAHTDKFRTAESYWERPSSLKTAKVRAGLVLDKALARVNKSLRPND